MLDGAIYGLASHGTFTGAFKPGNRSRHVKGLYLAGGAAHPGPGMPMVLMSGWIAADALDRGRQGGGRCRGPRERRRRLPRRRGRAAADGAPLRRAALAVHGARGSSATSAAT